ncbi:UNVERIFIED_CONTAM: hypothetical protein Scaly_2425200 [Sesamum calycinum]|uniref:DUF4218 domain-containing protein n=1 Tax=Sesamum calycinum TaxID=2727403 RepID=A0AAW2M3H5_9LAMI
MAFGWSSVGVMGCPICMNDTRAFHLQHSRKTYYFDYHRQFLPAHHSYRRNKKAFTKNRVENKVARPRLIGDQILDRVANISPAVESHYLMAMGRSRRGVCEWIRGLKFSDGYASNLARCVDMMELRIHGMKSHDCHVFMQKLILIAFREILSEHVSRAITEVSLLFQSKCSTTLDVHKLHELENSISIILYNIKKIFPPAFFDSMEHLIVHFLHEARIRGPVQCRSMYPFERFLCELKKKVKTKARVEASIVEAYIVEEIDLFTSKYFEPDVSSKRSMPRRNDKCTSNNNGFQVSVFNYPVRASGPTKQRWLSGPERDIIETYILTNCEVVTTYYECRWVDPVRGMKVHPRYHLIDVNFKKLYQKDDSFTLSQTQV